MTPEATGDVRTITAQVFAAFGQGSGPVLLTTDATQFLLDHFVPKLQAHASKWDSIALLACEHARQLGRIAAGLAAQAGVTEIEKAQAREAVRIMHASAERGGVAPCPVC